MKTPDFTYSSGLSKLWLLGLLISFNSLLAQDQISRSVISTGGGQESISNSNFSYTVGETVIVTGGASFFITQGFEQFYDGNGAYPINFDITTFKASCPGRKDGSARISNISGCAGPYQVIFSAGLVGIDSSLVRNLGEGQYSVQVLNANGCESPVKNFTITTASTDACLLRFYSGLTPNNDGINDSWIIENVDLFPDNEIAIYNRLGNKVWQGIDYDNDNTVWKGENLSGNPLPSDTYFYVFEANGDIEKGWIELTR
jgi:gliding motility-associated-like protein